MALLVTGSSGQVGRAVSAVLEARGDRVRRFDLAVGDDLRDPVAVREAADGCSAIVHAGALAHDTAGTPEDIVATNVGGTWHVLRAAEHARARRVVVFSSGQVFGCAEGEGEPEHLPIDDDHPLRAARPYGMSKRMVEEMCEAWTARTGIPTVVLRPVLILDDDGLATTAEAEVELGAFVHVDDVVRATVRALDVDLSGHHRLLLCGPGSFDAGRAEDVLGWAPRRGWPGPITR
ncbi:MAG: NAD-dependent epimerase/dehydratase family protein [Actinomycetota bacterium]